jgi:hypothetical protein
MATCGSHKPKQKPHKSCKCWFLKSFQAIVDLPPARSRAKIAFCPGKHGRVIANYLDSGRRRWGAASGLLPAIIVSWFLLAQGAAAQPPSVSNIGFEALSHSSVAVTFSVSSSINASRLRYIPTAQGSCTSGSGQVQNNSFGSATNILSYIRLDLTGLAPNTQYQVCPEVSSDWGSTWSSGVGATFTTLPLPVVHPALPNQPATFDSSYPDTTKGTCGDPNAANNGAAGYCVVYRTDGSACSNLSGDIARAVSNQMNFGTIIQIPAGTTCTERVWWEQIAPDAIPYDPSKVSNNTITLSNHGLSEGQGLVFDNTLQGGDIYNAAMLGGIIPGYVYFAHIIDANNFQLLWPWTQTTGSTVNGSATISVASTAGYASSPGIAVGQEVTGPGIPSGTTVLSVSGNTLTLSANATATANNVTLSFGGSVVSISPGGTPSSANYNTYFVKWPRPIPYWVIVRTSTPDSQFAPPGTRVGPQWASKMAVLQMPPQTSYQQNIDDVLLAPLYGYDPYGSTFATKIRFTGIEFTWTPNTELSSDPVSHNDLVLTQVSDSNIVFDRDWFHNPGGRQDRVVQAFNVQGMNIAIRDSYWDGMDYWHANYKIPGAVNTGNNSTSPAPSEVSSTSFTVPATTVYYGAANPATLSSPLTISWSGTTTVSNPEIAVYFDMSGNLITAVPSGITATVSAGSLITLTTGGNGSCTEGDPVIPSDSYGREAAAPLGCATLNSSGAISGLVSGSVHATELTEGCQCFLGGVGPGPYQILNNFISGTGLVMHFDDAGGGRIRGDYLIQRNTYHTPFQHMSTLNNPYAQAAGIPSDGYAYEHRQPLEWKGGQRVWIDGNIFDGTYRDVTPNGVFFDITPRTDGSSTDFNVTNNTFQHGPVGTSPITPIDGCCGNYMSWPGARYRLYNNLFWDINGWVYSTGTNGSGGNYAGFGAILPATGGPNEDLIVDHNTFYDFQGQNPQWVNWSGYPLEGFQMTNNIVSFSNGSGFATPGYSNSANCGSANESFINCAFSSEGTPDYIFKDNVIIPSWSVNGYPPSGQMTQAVVEGYFPDYVTQNYFLPNTSGVPAAYASLGLFNASFGAGNFNSHPDFHLQSASAYQSGGSARTTDGKAAGADVDALQAAQGKVTLIGANGITSSSANISYVAPDAAACSVDYSSSDPTVINSFNRVLDAGGNRVRNVSLTGLTTKTTYYYRVDCAVQQPSGSFRTN